MDEQCRKEVTRMLAEINTLTEESVVIINRVIEFLTETAAVIHAPLDGKLVISCAQLKRAKQLLLKITGE